MKNRVHYRYLSALVLLAFIAFSLTWILSGYSIHPYSTYKINTEDSVSGLVVDAPVEYKGVEVGKVKSIELKNRQVVEILLSIKKDMPITKGTRAILTTRGVTTRGFTGFVYVTLTDNSTDLRPLVAQPGQSYPVILTAPSSALSMDTSIVQMNQNLKQVTELFQSVLDKDNLRTLKELLHNLNKVTKILAINSQKLNSLLTNTEKASIELEPFLKSTQSTMKMLESQTLPAANRTFSQLESFLKSGQYTIQTLNRQTLPKAYQMLFNLDSASHALLNVAKEINPDPAVLIRGKAPPSPGPGE